MYVQARLVLGALLHPYRQSSDAIPGHIHEAFDELLRHLDLWPGETVEDAEPRLLTAISALGNARWPAAEQRLSPFVNSTSTVTSRAALDALIRLPPLSQKTYAQLDGLKNDSLWRNRSMFGGFCTSCDKLSNLLQTSAKSRKNCGLHRP